MEASQTGQPGEGQPQEGQGAEGAQAPEETAPVEGQGAEAGGGDAAPVEDAHDEAPAPDSDERNPARDQAPVASDAQDAVVGDPGLRDEQQPVQNEGTASAVDRPVRTSAPPPSAQSGVPLAEDRAAGVEPGTSGPAVPGGEEAEAGEDVPEHDASGGQSTTPPLGG